MRNGWIGFKRSFALGILLVLACASRPAPEASAPTLKTFEGNYELIWNVAFDVLHNENKIPVQQASKEIGFIASDWVKQERTVYDKKTNTYLSLPSRYRVNISFRRAPAPYLPAGMERVTVAVSKHLELKTSENWRTLASDFDTEAKILATMSRELEK